MQNEGDDDWLRRLVAEDLGPPVPRAAVADRVMTAVQFAPIAQSNQRLHVVLFGVAVTAALWLVCLAIPAWQYLSLPAVSAQHQLADALTLFE